MTTNEKPGFTPGPWRVSGGNNVYGSVVADHPHECCHSNPDDVEAYGGHLIAESIRGANRNLIAASPDLYWALNELLDISKYAEWNDGGDRLEAALEAGLAALAKARGES